MKGDFDCFSPGWLKLRPAIIIRTKDLHRIIPWVHLGFPESIVGDPGKNNIATFCFGFTQKPKIQRGKTTEVSQKPLHKKEEICADPYACPWAWGSCLSLCIFTNTQSHSVSQSQKKQLIILGHSKGLRIVCKCYELLWWSCPNGLLQSCPREK